MFVILKTLVVSYFTHLIIRDDSLLDFRVPQAHHLCNDWDEVLVSAIKSCSTLIFERFDLFYFLLSGFIR